MTSRTRPTALDVARLSGVSRTTVSYVLNKTPDSRIPDATRQKVLDAAQSLGYVPHAPAQALAAGRTRIALVDLGDVPFGVSLQQVARLMANALREEGFIPIIDQVTRASRDRAALLELAATLRPALVITMLAVSASERAQLETSGVRTILASYATVAELAETLAQPTRLQIRYLQERGHSLLAFATNADPETRELSAARRQAATEEAYALGLPTPVALETGGALEGTAERLRRMVKVAGVTAVAAYNDEIALEVLAAARSVGLRVPEDVAVIGVDDLPFAALISPALTTVRADYSSVGTELRSTIRTGTADASAFQVTETVVARETT